ncbi:MAG: serine hydrolase [Pseudomonadota bacterium]|nr:serine hydrolase [Pseudomonadota bacterium]
MFRIFLIIFFIAASAALWVLHGAAKIGVGYSAKQLCSGVFISHLPSDFVVEKDIIPRLKTVAGMDRFAKVAVGETSATVSILTATATASYRDRYGCTLHAEETANAETLEQERVERSAAIETVKSTNPIVESAIDALFEELPGGGRNTLAVLVMQSGEIVSERYASPVGPRTRLQGWSMNKSLMASLVGIQVERGAIGLSMLVKERLLDLGTPAPVVSDVDEALSLEHLITMASGLDFDERYLPGDDVTEMLYGGVPMWQVPLAQGHRVAPGQEFVYSSGDTNLVSYLWQASLEGEAYVDWIDREVNQRLGLDNPLLEPDISGVQVGSSFAYLTARDWAKYGQWWLDAWHGRDPVLSSDWQQLAASPSATADFYGLSFWLNTHFRDYPGLPESTFHAGGNSGQFVIVVPEAELVIVRLGLTLDESAVALAEPLGDIYAELVKPETLAINIHQ